MIKINSANLKLSPVKTISSTSKTDLGVTSRKHKLQEVDSPYTSTSTGISQLPTPGMGPNVGVSNNPITIDFDPLLTGITPALEHYFYRLYRDIYYHDPVAGSTVDLMSNLPFSEFTLGGISDPSISKKFLETLEVLNLRTLPSEISVDYLVTGTHVSSLLYNATKKCLTDIMPHAIENLTVDELPFYSKDPIITVKFPEHIAKTLAKDSPRIKRLKDHLGETIFNKIMHGSLELDPLSTLYIPRKTFSTTDLGTSYFKRILPIYLIEKNLFRGTLIESARRQRGILHLTLGDGDQWIPTNADMEFISDLFLNADSDPLGAIIATRSGVTTEELRQGGEFWKHTDFADSVLPHKLRALGISESFLSGDASYQTADQSLSVFIDMLRSYRDRLTRKLFYDRIFPLISLINGFTLNAKGKLVIKEGLMNEVGDVEDALIKLNDGSKLLIPSVTWTKQLKPEGDSAYMEMLNGLTEKGVPVPLRVLAAAGGLNLDEMLKQQDDDIDTRRKIASYTKRLEEFNPKAPAGEGSSESSVLLTLASEDPTGKNVSAVQAKRGKIPLLERKFGEDSEARGTSKTGKSRYIINQSKANEKINKNLARALAKAVSDGKFNNSSVPVKKAKNES